MYRVPVDPATPEVAAIAAAVAVIRAGGVVAMPTDTLYGLAADPASGKAVERVFALKRRAAGQPLPLVAADVEQVESLVGRLPGVGRELARRLWPGPLTLLVAAPVGLDRAVTAGTGRIGVRVPAHAVPRALCAAARSLLTATSANLSGHPAPQHAEEVMTAIGDSLDMLLDAGPTSGGPPSTIVDVTGRAARLVRAGAVPWERIEACLRPT